MTSTPKRALELQAQMADLKSELQQLRTEYDQELASLSASLGPSGAAEAAQTSERSVQYAVARASGSYDLELVRARAQRRERARLQSGGQPPGALALSVRSAAERLCTSRYLVQRMAERGEVVLVQVEGYSNPRVRVDTEGWIVDRAGSRLPQAPPQSRA